jgi:hypothetical protein
MNGPNFIVPTPPAGDSTNRAASTQFVSTAIANFSAALPTIPSTSQIDFISGGIASPANQDYRIIESLPFPMTYNQLVAKLSTGTLTALLKINATTMVTLNVGTSQVSSIISSSNTGTTGAVLILTVSGTANSPANLSFMVKFTRGFG